MKIKPIDYEPVPEVSEELRNEWKECLIKCHYTGFSEEDYRKYNDRMIEIEQENDRLTKERNKWRKYLRRTNFKKNTQSWQYIWINRERPSRKKHRNRKKKHVQTQERLTVVDTTQCDEVIVNGKNE